MAEKTEKEKLRIDKYLWSIRIFKTRSMATDACDAGRVKMHESAVKPSRNVAIGDTYEIRTSDRKWIIKVTGLLQQRKAYSEAINFYEDLTPEEDKTNTKSESSSFYTGKRLSKVGRPTKKQRRDWDDIMDET
ncbi:RNA-binding S4 domain-containing protein [Edaphocola flava]|jgi:ribosome-associated heat shock protein Hsp15|uniref:RNA-binding S4 domain-containing protein n=1 Tax=Edaphocola flava TaxID=2499629 RepID=UPI00100B9612|nr:RNA-binding S4 domain-containing protein [Edaphocola flava]